MPSETFTIIPATHSYPARVVVDTFDIELKNKLDKLSIWNGSDKEIFDCPSWEMGVEEIEKANKLLKDNGLREVKVKA